MKSIRIGIDVGGTFTDLFLFDEADGRTLRHKLSSTPADPYQAPIQGIREILRRAGAQSAQVKFVGLGTTVATNALLERKGATTGLITTAGFRDLLELGRQRRPHVYDLFVRKPAPLVRRELRAEVVERIGPDGSVLTALDEDSAVEALDRLVALGASTIAVCFLHSYANPAHENRVVDIARARHPAVTITSSRELIPEFREYERLSSTVVNAYLMPVMSRYLGRFSEAVRELGIPETPFVMSSGGGVASPALAARRPIDLLLSGPSGGVSGALFQAKISGYPDLITFDMGGTSTDVCLIQDSRAEVTHGRTIDGLPIRSTAVDVHTVGAGGSSIAWIDAGGFLRCGPHSAGANPGPACFGREGGKPTVTDANVVLGRLNQEYLLGGALRIDANRSRQVLEAHVARLKGCAVHEAAAAILAITNTNIAQAIRHVSVERGLDASRFMLVAFGGAGPLHAADVARELGMTVLVPPGPGVLCAMGVLTKDIQLDLSQTRLVRGAKSGAATEASSILADLERRGLETLARNGVATDHGVIERSIDARYVGQNFELPVPLPENVTEADLLDAVAAGFHAVHKRLYGYDQPAKEVELVTFRMKVLVAVAKPDFARSQEARAAAAPLARSVRDAYFHTLDAFVPCPVYERDDFAPGMSLSGPAIVEQMDTTTIVPPDFDAKADPWGNLILTRTR
jgi:N-methylhydantoinase A